MTNRTQWKSNIAADTGRMPSPNIWASCPEEQIRAGDVDGVLFFDDFLSGPKVAAGAEAVTGIYKGFADTGGSVAAVSAYGGALVAGSDGDNEGASIAMLNYPFLIQQGMGQLWFEARIKSSTITDTKHGIFIGLAESLTLSATVPIAAAGTLADQNFVGFHRLEGDGDMLDTVYKANGVTQVTLQADAITLVADTYVKVGMVFTPKNNTLTFYKDGVPLSTTYAVPSAAGTDFPNDVTMGLIFAVLNATGTTPGTSTIDWWKCAQLYLPNQ